MSWKTYAGMQQNLQSWKKSAGGRTRIMRSKSKFIASFFALALLIWVLDAALDYLFPRDVFFLHMLQTFGAVIIAAGLYGTLAVLSSRRHHQAEEALAKSETELSAIFNNAPSVMILVDSERRVRRANHSAVRFSSRPDEEMIGLRYGEALRCLHFLDDPAGCGFGPFCETCEVRRTVVDTFETGKNYYRVEAKLQVNGGGKQGEINMLISTALLSISADPMLLVCLEDITELKKTREQLHHSQFMASLGEMTAGIAHEVNNPLGSILLYSELLMTADVSSQTKKDLKVIHDEAKRAAKIMTDLLTYGRRVKAQNRLLNLHRILKKVMDIRRYQERVRNISVTTNLLDRPLYAKGDSSRLTQVFLNLMLNAEEALGESKGGNIVITTEIEGEWAKISIADDGTGIPEKKLDQVFYPFFSTKKIGESTGLGLSICYGIVTEHSGLIRAENNDMGGATFIVELPLAKIRGKKGKILSTLLK